MYSSGASAPESSFASSSRGSTPPSYTSPETRDSGKSRSNTPKFGSTQAYDELQSLKESYFASLGTDKSPVRIMQSQERDRNMTISWIRYVYDDLDALRAAAQSFDHRRNETWTVVDNISVGPGQIGLVTSTNQVDTMSQILRLASLRQSDILSDAHYQFETVV